MSINHRTKMKLNPPWCMSEGYEDEERGDWCNNFGRCEGRYLTYGDYFYCHPPTGRRYCEDCARKAGAFKDGKD